MYDRGYGVPQDYAEAMRWHRLAADQGQAQSQCLLRRRYDLGVGVPQDHVEAHMWYDLAASRMIGEEPFAAVWNPSEARDGVAGRMDPTQIAEGQRLAREWDAAHC